MVAHAAPGALLIPEPMDTGGQPWGRIYRGRTLQTKTALVVGWLRHSPRITSFVTPNSIQIVNLLTQSHETRPARRQSIDLAVAGAGTACTSKSVLAVQPDSFLQMCVQCMASGCRFLRSLTARRSTGQSRPPPQTQTAGWAKYM